jgi:hypothetical protein
LPAELTAYEKEPVRQGGDTRIIPVVTVLDSELDKKVSKSAAKEGQFAFKTLKRMATKNFLSVAFARLLALAFVHDGLMEPAAEVFR